MNDDDTKLKVDALEWRVELPVASKAQVRVRFSSVLHLFWCFHNFHDLHNFLKVAILNVLVILSLEVRMSFT